MEWMIMPFKRYADFSGRSRRMEFWMYQLLQTIVGIVLYGIILSGMPLSEMMAMQEGQMAAEPTMGTTAIIGIILAVIWALFSLVPSLAVTVRRLHDRNMSGWWYLGFFVLMIIPFVGFIAAIAFIVIMFLDGTPGPNRFGSDPKGRADVEVFS